MGMIMSFRGASEASEPGIHMQARNIFPGMTGDLRPQFQHKTAPPKAGAAALGGGPGDGGRRKQNLSVSQVIGPAGGTMFA
jgi:hypothetical protein